MSSSGYPPTVAGHPYPVDPVRVAAARARVPGREDAASLSAMLSLLADGTRARVLYALDVVDELCVGDLAMALEATEDAVGYALRLLRTAGFVSSRKEGRVVYYRLAEGFPQPLREDCLRGLIEFSRRAAPADGRPGPDLGPPGQSAAEWASAARTSSSVVVRKSR